MENIKTLKKTEIKAYGKNNKNHPRWQIDALKKSISEYGYIQPIVVDNDEKRNKYLKLLPKLQKQRKTLLQRFKKNTHNSIKHIN